MPVVSRDSNKRCLSYMFWKRKHIRVPKNNAQDKTYLFCTPPTISLLQTSTSKPKKNIKP